MNSHTLEITTLHALNGDSVSITSASRTADTAALSFRLDSVNDSAPWAFGDEVTLTENGKPIFHGYVTEEPETSIDAGGLSCSVTLRNIVALLDATPFTGDQSFSGIATRETRVLRASLVLNRVLEHGLVLPGGGSASGHESFVVDVSSSIKCPIGSGSSTCWGLVESCLHWVPDAVTWYNPESRVLSVRRAGSGSEVLVDVASGVVRRGEEVLFRFAGFESASFRPRYDLRPPVVGLTWEGTSKSVVFPSGGKLNQPWAFHYQVPKVGGDVGGELSGEAARAVQRAAQPKMVVRGRKVPPGWELEGDMKSEAPGAPGLWHEFWKSLFRPLAKTNVSCLSYGLAVFEPVPVEDAFPADPEAEEEETEFPANYVEFEPGQYNNQLYLLYEGQFPASSKSRDNVSGLKFCRGKLKQYVWLKDEYVGLLTEAERMEFFSGSARVNVNGVSAKTRFALLELDAVFINRRRKKYQVGSNVLDATDDDFSADDGSTGGDGAVEARDADYQQAASDFYDATRKLFFDGSIVLRGVEGYAPALLDGCNMSVVGSRAEWENMETPVVQAEFNPVAGSLVLSTGSPEILTIDERVQRTLLGRQGSSGAGTSFAAEPVAAEDDGSEGEEEEEEDFPMVSPSISAQTVALKSGRPLNPFEVFQDGDKWYMNEGTWPAFGQILHWPTTDVTDKKNMYDKLGIDVDFDEAGKPVLVVRGYGKKAGTGGDA